MGWGEWGDWGEWSEVPPTRTLLVDDYIQAGVTQGHSSSKYKIWLVEGAGDRYIEFEGDFCMTNHNTPTSFGALKWSLRNPSGEWIENGGEWDWTKTLWGYFKTNCDNVADNTSGSSHPSGQYFVEIVISYTIDPQTGESSTKIHVFSLD